MSQVDEELTNAIAKVVFGTVDVPWTKATDGETVVSWTLPAGHHYGCVATVQAWISVTKACPLVDVKNVTASGARIGILSQQGTEKVGDMVRVSYVGYAY